MADDNPNLGAGDGNASGISQADLHKAIEKARLEERSNLKSKIETAEVAASKAAEDVKRLTAENANLENQISKLSEQVKALTASTKSEGGIDIEKAIESAVTSALQRQEAALGKELQQLRSELDTERGVRQTVERRQLRSQMIADAGGDSVLIPDLVAGNSQEEIAASIEHSKAVFARIVGKTGGGGTESGAGNPPKSVPLGGTSGGGNPPSGGSAAANGGASLRDMSIQDYGKNREALKRQALAQAKSGSR